VLPPGVSWPIKNPQTGACYNILTWLLLQEAKNDLESRFFQRMGVTRGENAPSFARFWDQIGRIKIPVNNK
jgi:hypothetical protein